MSQSSKEFLLSDNELLERNKKIEDLCEKYSNFNETEDDGCDLNDLIAIYEEIDQNNEESFNQFDEAEEKKESIPQKEPPKSDQSVQNQKNKTNQQYGYLIDVFGKNFVDNMKQAYLTRNAEVEKLNLGFFKRTKTFESCNESSIKTANYNALRKQSTRSREENLAVTSTMADPTVHFKVPLSNQLQNEFKFPFPANINNISSMPSFQLAPNMSFNITHPMFQNPNMTNQMCNVRVREVFYDYVSVCGNDITGQFYNILPNASAAVDSSVQQQSRMIKDKVSQTKEIKKKDKSKSKVPSKDEQVKKSSTKIKDTKDTQINNPVKVTDNDTANIKVKDSVKKAAMSYSDCVKLPQDRDSKIKVQSNCGNSTNKHVNKEQIESSKKSKYIKLSSDETAQSTSKNEKQVKVNIKEENEDLKNNKIEEKKKGSKVKEMKTIDDKSAENKVRDDKELEAKINKTENKIEEQNQKVNKNAQNKPKKVRSSRRIKQQMEKDQENKSTKTLQVDGKEKSQVSLKSSENVVQQNVEAKPKTKDTKNEVKPQPDSINGEPKQQNIKKHTKKRSTRKRKQFHVICEDDTSSEDLTVISSKMKATETEKKLKDDKIKASSKDKESVKTVRGKKKAALPTIDENQEANPKSAADDDKDTKPYDALEDFDSSLDDFEYFKAASEKYFAHMESLKAKK